MRALVLVAFAIAAACGSSAHGPDAMPDAGPWSAGPTLPGARLEPGVTALGDRLVVLGGFDLGIKGVPEVDVLDTISNTWSRLPDAPVAWNHVDLAADTGSLFILGGLDDKFAPFGGSYVLDANATAWRTLTSMPNGLERGSAAVVVRAPYIYLIGGASAVSSLATVLQYDVANDKWAQLPDLPAPRSHPAAAILPDGTIVVVGGLGTLDSTAPLADVVALPVGATAWVTRAAMPTARGGCAYGLFGTRFLCVGGEADGLAMDNAEAYDWVHDTWSTLPSMPMRRAGTQGAAIGARLFVPGGAHQLRFDPVDDMDILVVE